MNEGLNLITNEEKFEQRTSLIFKIINISFIFFLLIVISFSIYSYNQLSKLKLIEESLRNEKKSFLNKLSAFVSEEQVLRDVIFRYKIYNNFSGQIEDVSEIIKEIYFRANGTTVEIMTINFDYDQKEISIRVKSTSDQFTRFVNNLKNTNFNNGASPYPNLFYPSSKNEEVDQAIKEYIVYIKYRPEVLKK